MGIVGGVDDAADRLGFLDLLSFHAQELSQPPALADGHDIEPGCRTFSIQLRLDNQILQNALGGSARRQGLDRRLAVQRLAGVLRGLLEFVERDENLRPALHNGFH